MQKTFFLIYFSWKLITLHYCSGFCKKLLKLAKSQVSPKHLHLKSGVLQDHSEVVSYFCSVLGHLFSLTCLCQASHSWNVILEVKLLIAGLIYHPRSPCGAIEGGGGTSASKGHTPYGSRSQMTSSSGFW